jgi:hypothetical protein
MISPAGTMQPLPVRPVDGVAKPGAPTPRPRHATSVMRPLPMPMPEADRLTSAIRDTAFQRMLDRLGVQQPLPVVDPTA